MIDIQWTPATTPPTATGRYLVVVRVSHDGAAYVGSGAMGPSYRVEIREFITVGRNKSETFRVKRDGAYWATATNETVVKWSAMPEAGEA